jgi:undecaprenyl-diphosphatase
VQFVGTPKKNGLLSLNFLPYRLSQQLALLVFLAPLVAVLFLSMLSPLDAAFAAWIESQRSCQLDSAVYLLQDRALIFLFVVGGLTLTVLTLRHRWEEARHALLVVLLGGFFCELLKTGIERPRPSVLPLLITGNSFPSGHTTTALLIAGTTGFLLWRGPWKLAVKIGVLATLLAAVGFTAGQRLYWRHHWLSDVIGSILLVSAWLCFLLPRPTLLSFSPRFFTILIVLFISYGCFYFAPRLRVALPSPLTVIGDAVVTVSFGRDEVNKTLRGAWGDSIQEPSGRWMNREEASVEVLLPERRRYLLKIAVRPMLRSKVFACFPLEVAINQQQVNSLLLYRGWREYNLSLDPRWIVPGRNTLSFRIGATFPLDGADQHTVAFRQLRLFTEKD